MGAQVTKQGNRQNKEDHNILIGAGCLAAFSLLLSSFLILDYLSPLRTVKETFVEYRLEYSYSKYGRSSSSHWTAVTFNHVFQLPDGFDELKKGDLLFLQTSFITDQVIFIQKDDYRLRVPNVLQSAWVAYFLLFPIAIGLGILTQRFRERVEIVLTGSAICLFNLILVLVMIVVQYV